MKTPRVQDFDPNAKPLELGSPMDNFPTIQKSKPSTIAVPPVPVVPLVRPVRDVPPVPLVPPKKRVIKQRQPFDIYQDQYESLKQFSVEDRMQGGVGSMSAMVREALDSFIAAKRKPKKGESI